MFTGVELKTHGKTSSAYIFILICIYLLNIDQLHIYILITATINVHATLTTLAWFKQKNND